MTDLPALLAKLEAWTEETRNFHGDRQLADEVLLACGWRVFPDPTFEGGVRWEFGTNPTWCASESSRPHPINSVDAALGQIPYGWALALGDKIQWVSEGKWRILGAECRIVPNYYQETAEHYAFAPARPVAICIAIVRALIAGAKP